MAKVKLLKETAEVYEVVNINIPAFVHPTYGEVRLHTITLDQANKLVAKGFPYLVKKSILKRKKTKD